MIFVKCSELHCGFGTVEIMLENTHDKGYSLVSVGSRVKNRSITKKCILSIAILILPVTCTGKDPLS